MGNIKKAGDTAADSCTALEQNYQCQNMKSVSTTQHTGDLCVTVGWLLEEAANGVKMMWTTDTAKT